MSRTMISRIAAAVGRLGNDNVTIVLSSQYTGTSCSEMREVHVLPVQLRDDIVTYYRKRYGHNETQVGTYCT